MYRKHLLLNIHYVADISGNCSDFRRRNAAAHDSTTDAIALAQDTTEDSQEQTREQKATNLDKIVVTGSLIPQTELETVTPVIVITAEDIHSRGFTSVADVLRSNSFSSGGVQGGETPNTFTQGAEAVHSDLPVHEYCRRRIGELLW